MRVASHLSAFCLHVQTLSPSVPNSPGWLCAGCCTCCAPMSLTSPKRGTTQPHRHQGLPSCGGLNAELPAYNAAPLGACLFYIAPVPHIQLFISGESPRDHCNSCFIYLPGKIDYRLCFLSLLLVTTQGTHSDYSLIYLFGHFHSVSLLNN